MLNKNMNPSNAKTQSIHYYSSGKFNLFHCYKYTNCLYCENFHFLQPLFLQKGSFIFFFSFFYTSHLSKCQPLILAALLVYPLNLNLFLNLLVLILTTIEFYYFYSKNLFKTLQSPYVLGKYTLASSQFFVVFYLQLLFPSHYPV